MILQLIYLFLPAYFANMTPVLVKKVPILNYPLDFNLKYKSKRFLGAHKTIRGLVFGILVGGIVFILQQQISLFSLEIIPYASLPFYFGCILGAGALLGDAIKSFFKRRANIKPGKPWIPFDQIDFILGALILSSPWYFPGWLESIIILIVSFILHILANHIAYKLNIRDVKW